MTNEINYNAFKTIIEAYVTNLNVLQVLYRKNIDETKKAEVVKYINGYEEYWEKPLKENDLDKEQPSWKHAKPIIKSILEKQEGVIYGGITSNGNTFSINGINFGINIIGWMDNTKGKYVYQQTMKKNFSYIFYDGMLNIDSAADGGCWTEKTIKGIECEQLQKLLITIGKTKIKSSPELVIDGNLYNDKITDSFKAFIDFYICEVKTYMVKKCVRLLEYKNNIILQGAPGTGKTYITDSIVLGLMGVEVAKMKREEITGKINELKEKDAQLAFCTFHQSMDYDDFVIGLRPEIQYEEDAQGNKKAVGVEYIAKPGIFKIIADRANREYERWENDTKNPKEPLKKYVLVIDEINRGNISKIFGELITLLEKGKRLGSDQPISVKLPYLNEGENKFSLPPNLYIIGTMNTTDRSAGNIDYAIRRRFAFVTLESKCDAVSEYYADKDEKIKKAAVKLFEEINGKSNESGFMYDNKDDSEIDLEDLKIGISYFMAETKEELELKLNYEIIPLIKEYIKDGLLKKDDDAQKAAFERWRNVVNDI
ncbi:MAG: AAA family ATPase [Lachnospiraceae bacterium]|nr:AAA family ATPase [Lachnospiraceae bacterium]